MMRQPKYVWVSVAEAAERIGVSVSTVRRMVEDGKLVGEREPLGGSRERYRVRFDASLVHQDASPSESDVTPPGQPDAPEMPQEASVTPQDASRLLSVALEPLTAALASERTERQKLAQENRALAERAAAAEALADERGKELERERQESARLRAWSVWKPWTW